MPTPYQMALLLIRLLVALNLVAGPTLIVASIVVASVANAAGWAIEGIPFMMLSYGIFYTVAGIAVFLVHKKIADFAAKV